MSSTDATPDPSPPPSPPSPSSPPHRSKTAPLPPKEPEPFPSTEDTSPLPPTTPSYSSPQTVPSTPPILSSLTSAGPPLSQLPQPALRRTSSNISSGSGPSREKKRLRFTQIPASGEQRSGEGSDEDAVFFPGSRESDAEEGRAGKRRIPRDQEYLRSDPGTPNLIET